MRRLLAAWCVAGVLAAGPARAVEVEVRVVNVRGDAGSVRVQVCGRGEWLKDCALTGKAAARAGEVRVVVPGVPEGVWGVIAFHDADDDGDVDQGFLGLPKEGVGFSREASIRLGAPGFDDAALRVEGVRVVVPVRLQFEP